VAETAWRGLGGFQERGITRFHLDDVLFARFGLPLALSLRDV
jgi:hypothetical protein